jgi:hypothetical protein
MAPVPLSGWRGALMGQVRHCRMSSKLCLCCGEKFEEASAPNPNTCADCEQWLSLEVPSIAARLSLPDELRSSEPLGFFSDPALVQMLRPEHGKADA